MVPASPPNLELRAITKRYPGTLANDAVSLCVAPGEIHAVLGENGAGKSTLMKIIYGAVQADSGEIRWQGELKTIANPAAARRLGIGMVYQHFSLLESVTVVENIALGTPGAFDLRRLAVRISELGDRYALPVDPHRLLHHLSVGERQRVEILRCLLQEPKLLILDEPTSVLTPQSAQRLFVVLRNLANTGCSILYISHKLDEIRELCDSATVLRRGRVVGSATPKEVSSAELARLMVGAAPLTVHREPADLDSAPRLSIRRLSCLPDDPFGTALREVSLDVHGGEIVGIAGVSGNGQAEFVSVLSGERICAPDMIALDGVSIGAHAVLARRRRGLAFVPEERLGRGAGAHLSLGDNALFTAHGRSLVRRGFVDRGGVARFAREIVQQFGVKCAGVAAAAHTLSGGNLQKFIMGREISLQPRVLIVAQPTWGVDVAAAAYIRQQLIDLSRRGAAVLVVSEEIDELFEICDRIAVMCQGRVSEPKARAACRVEEIGLLMAGVGSAFDAAA
jgi:general nucleoside transport system ATP-binding protein